MKFKTGDIVVIVSCPGSNWVQPYIEFKAEGRLSQLLPGQVRFLNEGHDVAIGDNCTGINYTKENLRLATPEEIKRFRLGFTHIRNEKENINFVIKKLRDEISSR